MKKQESGYRWGVFGTVLLAYFFIISQRTAPWLITILLVTGGRGYYQEEGKPARELHTGDVVKIAPGVKHWHGAAPDS
ncbi:hypothetical protein BpJC7_13850 [Weizmannia acidilactici]|uniref:Cupin domain-containing protein n=1 Tax=Weizmannia acidilactici TaxID=2607726 RepID=A0A5J4J539_9BACI|nr:hypothetical protein BpJC4_13000 [Weizmannia acidilactici]GER70082.1 hypothetical protein BpJC7_13850 [Weizmannia acidilactici]GER74162.1 hypothetical protein BpPP18_22290 [Weizmannia acidilactici]